MRSERLCLEAVQPAGALLDATVTVLNDSNVDGGTFEIRSYLSTDGTLGEDDHLLYTGDPFAPEASVVATVTPNEEMSFQLQYTVSEQLESGAYQLIAQLVFLDGRAEDESDNLIVSGPFELIGGRTLGTAGNDVFSRTSASDTIEGYGGDDAMTYSPGEDFFDAGMGFDSVDYSTATGSVAFAVVQDAVLVYDIYSDSTDVLVEVNPEGWDPYVFDPAAQIEIQFLRDVQSFTGTDGHDGFCLLGTTAVEINVGGGADEILTGNDADIINAGADDDLIGGMDGDDLITTGDGLDQIFAARNSDGFGNTTGQGQSVVSDFDPLMDVLLIKLTGLQESPWDPLTSISDTVDGAMVQYADDSSVLFTGVTATELDQFNLIANETDDIAVGYLG